MDALPAFQRAGVAGVDEVRGFVDGTPGPERLRLDMDLVEALVAENVVPVTNLTRASAWLKYYLRIAADDTDVVTNAALRARVREVRKAHGSLPAIPALRNTLLTLVRERLDPDASRTGSPSPASFPALFWKHAASHRTGFLLYREVADSLVAIAAATCAYAALYAATRWWFGPHLVAWLEVAVPTMSEWLYNSLFDVYLIAYVAVAARLAWPMVKVSHTYKTADAAYGRHVKEYAFVGVLAAAALFATCAA